MQDLAEFYELCGGIGFLDTPQHYRVIISPRAQLLPTNPILPSRTQSRQAATSRSAERPCGSCPIDPPRLTRFPAIGNDAPPAPASTQSHRPRIDMTDVESWAGCVPAACPIVG